VKAFLENLTRKPYVYMYSS